MYQIIREKIKSFQTVLMIVITPGYLLGTHLSTINSLELALSAKAERSDMIHLDKKLTRIEVKLEEAVITRQEISELCDRIDRHLEEYTARLRRINERMIDDGK